RRLDDADGGGVGDAVARADDEVVQVVPAAAAAPGARRLGGARRGRGRFRRGGGGWRRGLRRGGGARGGLVAARLLEQLRVDAEAHRARLAEHVRGGLADHLGELFLQP